MSLKEFLKNEPIFVVDDDVDLAEVFKEMLEELEVPIKVFLKPQDALQAIKQQTPSIILSDITMTDMDGLEFSSLVREILPNLPIVLISGNATKEIAIRALKVGINELLDKPVQRETLLGIVNKFLTVRARFLEREKEELEVIIDSFVDESFELLTGIDELIMQLEGSSPNKVLIDNLFRRIHSIKGSVGTVPDSKLFSKLTHEFESSLDLIRRGAFVPTDVAVNIYLTAVDAIKKSLEFVKNREIMSEPVQHDVSIVIGQLVELNHKVATGKTDAAAIKDIKPIKTMGSLANGGETIGEDQGVLVQNDKLDALLKLSGEMTMVRNYFQILSRDAESQSKPEILYKKSDEMLRGFNKITDSLQKQIMELRQVQLDTVFSKLPRIVRTTAQELGKKVQIKTLGGDVGIDKNIAKDLGAVFVHMIRNSIDHGIETTQKRLNAGKNIEGLIIVEAQVVAGSIRISITDDGAGLDRKKIEERAVSKQLVTPDQIKLMGDEEVYQFIFTAGFSTAEQVTKYSGRGVGMDVVSSLITSHHGRIQISSTQGKGTTFAFVIPVLKSVLVESTIMVKDNGLVIGIPQAEISYITIAKDMKRSLLGASRSVQYDNQTIPMFSYNELIDGRRILAEEEVDKKSVIIMQHKEYRLALLVDSIDGQFDAVIIPFDNLVKSLPGFKGTTLLGSDGVAYIVSVQKMISLLNYDLCKNEVAV